MLAKEVAKRSGYNSRQFSEVTLDEMQFAAPRPQYSVLTSEKGFEMPLLENALDRFFHEQVLIAL